MKPSYIHESQEGSWTRTKYERKTSRPAVALCLLCRFAKALDRHEHNSAMSRVNETEGHFLQALLVKPLVITGNLDLRCVCSVRDSIRK